MANKRINLARWARRKPGKEPARRLCATTLDPSAARECRLKRILVPTRSVEDWQPLLAKPELHWKAGYSAMTLAKSWETAHPGIPPEVESALKSAHNPLLSYARLLLAVPEYEVDLPGGRRPSQTDLLALLEGTAGLVAVAVEGKVDEPFGPTVGEKRSEHSPGVDTRLKYMTNALGLASVPDSLRYQLLHRTVSALLIALEFHAEAAVMLVQSFSPTEMWFSDFELFAELLDVEVAVGHVARVPHETPVPLFVGWCRGDQAFRAEGLTSAST